eukprot:6730586-Lingulodinium_polyedra.AAC.1
MLPDMLEPVDALVDLPPDMIAMPVRNRKKTLFERILSPGSGATSRMRQVARRELASREQALKDSLASAQAWNREHLVYGCQMGDESQKGVLMRSWDSENVIRLAYESIGTAVNHITRETSH